MTPTIRLGRVFGIQVGFNWSLIFIFVLIAWTLAANVLPVNAPGYSTTLYWVVGATGAILFFACLLAHELAHSIVARRYGVKVSGITLWLFGGVSSLEGEPSSAPQEAWIAGVGPLTSLVIGGIAFVLMALTSGNALVQALFGYLTYVNIALGLFNLVPAFPLDGGRLLSSLLWWRSGSRLSGVHNAVRVGRVFAYLLIGLGVLSFFAGSALNGIWFAFLGWFLLSAATQEEQGSAIRTLLHDVPVSAAMSAPVVTLPDWVTVDQFLESVAPNHSFTTYPVHEQSGKLTGVVRLSDLVRMPRADRATKRLSEVAVPIASVPVTSPGEDLAQMIQRVGAGLDQRVLVFDNGQLAGIVSPADIARVLAARQSATSSRPAGAAPSLSPR